MFMVDEYVINQKLIFKKKKINLNADLVGGSCVQIYSRNFIAK